MIIELFFIYKRGSLKVKIEIYDQTIRVIIKSIFKSFLSCIIVWQEIGLEKVAVEIILMMYANWSVWQYHPIIVNIDINYKKNIVITSIKLGI